MATLDRKPDQKLLRDRVMMVSSEVSPWAKSGGLADVLGALPGALATLGYQVAVVVPRYMDAAKTPATCVIDRMAVPLGPENFDVSVWAMNSEAGAGSVTHYFVENSALFGPGNGREGLYGNADGDYPDNHIRFAVLARAALEISRRLFHANVFHCHDWQASLLPVFLRDSLAGDPEFAGARTLLTIHNLGYQGLFPAYRFGEIGLSPHFYNPAQLEFWGQINFLKAGIVFSNAINTVSRKYAEEIQTPEYGFGLEGVLVERRGVLSGILNGVDYTRWNPEADPHLAHHLHAGRSSLGKRECKRALLQRNGHAGTPDRPAAAGHRLPVRHAKRIRSHRRSGVADLRARCLRSSLSEMAKPATKSCSANLHPVDFPDKVAVKLGFSEPMAHRIEACSDIFLMPSQYEPCGLNQIYSLKYGTVPVVRATGGLDDTIDESTGFKFADYKGSSLLAAIGEACEAWENHEAWAARMVRGMNRDFSWAAFGASVFRALRAACRPAVESFVRQDDLNI